MITIEQLGGRKFLLSVLIIILTFLLIVLNRLSAKDYLQIAFAVIALYTGLNVYQKAKLGQPIDKKLNPF